jgi:type II secretory pathway pseudopilin PulG
MDTNTMVVGTLFGSLLTSMFASDSANEQEMMAARQKAAALAAQQADELQRAKAAAAQAEFEKMMQSYKQLDGSQGAAYKSLSNLNVGFKTPDDDAETLAANARKPFDTASEPEGTRSADLTGGTPTPFFGDTMPMADIQLLVNPENDPNVVDLRNANAYVADNIKKGPSSVSGKKRSDGQADGVSLVRGPECAKLAQKLDGFVVQRANFQKTIYMAQEQLQTWQTANRNALVNAAKDGVDYFIGWRLEKLTNRGKAADRLQRIYEKNAKQMAQEGLDVTEMTAKIKRLRLTSSAGKLSEVASNTIDWQAFIKDGTSSIMAQLTSSNDEIRAMLEDPKMQKYFETEAPELNTLLDISTIAASNEVFGKWIAKKVPIIAAVELAINEHYNGWDWYLSYKRIAEAHEINGKVMNAARSIQNNIDATYLALGQCQ